MRVLENYPSPPGYFFLDYIRAFNENESPSCMN